MRKWIGCGCIGLASIAISIAAAIHFLLPTGLLYFKYGYADLPAFMERRTATIDNHPVSFLISKFSENAFKWGLANDPSRPRSVHEWRKDLGADFVMNGSYFTETNQPSGFYSIDGGSSAVPWPATAFNENGYTFAVNITDGKMNMYFVPASSMLGPYSGSTFLSFPTLVLNDTPMVATDSGLHARRTVLAETNEGVIYVIVSEAGEESLYQMAQWLVAQPEHFRIAGNLDGGPSTGISTESSPWNIEVQSATVPNVIWVRNREY